MRKNIFTALLLALLALAISMSFSCKKPEDKPADTATEQPAAGGDDAPDAEAGGDAPAE